MCVHQLGLTDRHWKHIYTLRGINCDFISPPPDILTTGYLNMDESVTLKKVEPSETGRRYQEEQLMVSHLVTE